ncbi:dihydroneopterin aldolase [Amphibiibacter pelophylacis]|uniref:Dihydroneopterin aldolase n=1 Tax=Amphibiibacter pelophylacis TaxID=1799477 RepID=A0ACC6P2A8_9BURK
MNSLTFGAWPDHALPPCRRLFLRNYSVQMGIGAHDFEKRGTQRVCLNVDLYVPLSSSTPSQDELDEVVDYDFIRSTIAARIATGHIQLQETLVDDLLISLLAHPRVAAVRLSSEKPDVYPDCDAVGVEVMGYKLGSVDSAGLASPSD